MEYTKTLTFANLIKYQLLGIEALDRASLKRLKPLLENVELELIHELDRFSEDQFSYQKRQQSIIAINKTLNKIENILYGDFKEDAKRYYDFGMDMSQQEVREFNSMSGIETPEINKTKVSLKQNEFLVNNAQASINTYTSGVRQNVSDAITQGMLAGRTGYEITKNLRQYINIKKWRIHRIVRTESHKIFNSAKLMAYGEFREQHFPDLMKRLYHPMDNRTADDSKQLARIDPEIPLDKPFKFTYKYRRKDGTVKEYKRVFMTPPDRPNDRSSIIPFRREWEDVK